MRTLLTRWRRLAPAALLAAAALGGTAFGDLAVADAAPNTGGGEWDIAAYDECIARGTNERLCCSQSGGVWSDGRYGEGPYKCQSPPANAPGSTVPPGVIKQTLTPDPLSPPPGDITQTFAPAP